MALAKNFDFDKDPVYLMDGNAFIFRAYFGNSQMTRSDSFPTGAIHTLGRLLMKIIREERPKYFLFVVDGRGPNFRHELYPDYKAQRPPSPEDLVAQFDPIHEMVRRLGVRLEVSVNCEADDCIASMAQKFSKERPVVIVGTDKDLRQCLNENVVMWDPASKEEKIITEDIFRENTGLSPMQWPDVQALIGDSSDNIPGVRGIGEKTAMKLILEYPNLESIRDNFENLSPSVKKKMDGNLEAMFLYRQLTTLSTGECADITLDDMLLSPSHEQSMQSFFKSYELNGLLKDYTEMVKKNILIVENAQGDLQGSLLGAITQNSDAVDGLPEPIFMDTPTESVPNEPLEVYHVENLPDCTDKVLAVIPETYRGYNRGYYLALAPLPKSVEFLLDYKGNKGVNSKNTDNDDTFSSENANVEMKGSKKSKSKNAQQSLMSLMEPAEPVQKKLNVKEEAAQVLALPTEAQKDICFVGEIKDLIPYMQNAAQIVLCDLKLQMHLQPVLSTTFKDFRRFFDLGVGAWLLSPDEKDYAWAAISARFALEHHQDSNHPAHLALALYENMLRQMEGRSLINLMIEMEMPLVPVLFAMEKIGVQINVGALFTFLDEVHLKIDDITKLIYNEAGGEFNIRSAQQIGEVLFKKLQLPMSKSTKGGQASTSNEVLEKLAGEHPIVSALQDYRKLEKLRSTYLEPLPRLTGKDGRIHTTFNQCATATGRLSSSNPNLQNIPVRGEFGQRMRSCFTAKPGFLLVSADYSQVELRVLAHCSGDETLRQAFLNNEDIHARTAAMLYDVELDAVSQDMRRHAKTINFGLLYGMGVRKLSQDLNISMSEGKRFMEVYFERFEQIKNFYDEVEEFARQHAYVLTLAGRQRALPDIVSANHQAKALAERQAVNTMIQGTAADIIKLAMLSVHKDTKLQRWKAKLLLQIHDELILEVPEDFADLAGERMAEIMMNIAPQGQKLSVPLLVDYGVGLDWGSAH